MNCFDVFLPLHYECLCASDVWDAKASFYETDSWRAGHRNIPRHCFHPPRHTHHQSTQHLCGAASVCFACGGWLRWDHKLQYWHRVPFYQRNLINFILIRFFFCSFSYRQSCGYLLQVWCDCKFKHTAFFALSNTWGILLFVDCVVVCRTWLLRRRTTIWTFQWPRLWNIALSTSKELWSAIKWKRWRPLWTE